MDKIYSKRNVPQPDTYRYDVPDFVRWRILHTLGGVDQDGGLAAFSIDRMLREVGGKVAQQYGALYQPAYRALSQSDNPVIEHFMCCTDTEALDFIELCFRVRSYCLRHIGVEVINNIFQEEAIGYELTPWREIETDEEPSPLGFRIRGAKSINIEYPKFVKKDDQFVHREIIRPCIEILDDPKFQIANSEMHKAHNEYRKGNYADAITSCGSAFESVMKTICDHHGWPYDPDRDTCSKLVSICRDHDLFPPFYAPIFETSGTIRNKLGDAHGRGPIPMYAIGKEQADHMIQMTSAHIILLIRLAKL